MTAPNTTKAQVQAYRFGMRRLETAVSTGQAYRRTVGGPRRGRSFLIGLVLAALVLAGFAVWALVSPEASIGDAKVVIDGDRGGVYVLRDNRLYPATNLASALLAAGAKSGGAGGEPAVKTVDASTLRGMARGQLLGIPGAPDQVPGESDLVAGTWTVCDVSTVDPAQAPSQPPAVHTTVVLGEATVTAAQVGNAATLVTPDGGKSTYLLWDGRRSPIDPHDHAVSLALGIDGLRARPISLGLLNAIPPGVPIVPPPIDQAGTPVPWDPQLTAGTVFAVHFAAGTAHYVALSDGVERITPVVADLIRAERPSSPGIPVVPLSAVKKAPQSRRIVLDDYPAARPVFYDVSSDQAGVAQARAICLAWSGGSGPGSYAVYPTTGVPLPHGAQPVPAPPGSAAGSADAVYVAPGHGVVFGQVTGDQKAATGALFLVTDSGVKYPVTSRQALSYLGLGRTIRPAAPSLLKLLPTGPVLDPDVAAGFFGQAGG